ncbi:hypothetical protein M8C13_06265 [Crossiella sp. SN42]|uniref:phage tail termination protein n=1 Tax=Crossiella sp. SN42 TaxID=2944808 RepID=UPI00207C5543|nr:hypothetical protein [Crossiella sp. SN42]MCO1575364.1 hypothetical protein [Crossiella sp. SN42]
MIPSVPSAEKLLIGLLREQLPGVQVVTLIPAPEVRRLPLVWVHRTGGAATHPLWLDQAAVSVECWAQQRTAAAELAQSARTALWAAYRTQAERPQGHIASYAEVSGPSEVRTRDQPDQLHRYLATYTLGIRPPRP